jgi:hypothetical protein
MRISWLLSLVAIASPIMAAPTSEETTTPDPMDGGPTTFNGLEVPPMLELSGTTVDEVIAQGNWYEAMR